MLNQTQRMSCVILELLPGISHPDVLAIIWKLLLRWEARPEPINPCTDFFSLFIFVIHTQIVRRIGKRWGFTTNLNGLKDCPILLHLVFFEPSFGWKSSSNATSYASCKMAIKICAIKAFILHGDVCGFLWTLNHLSWYSSCSLYSVANIRWW